MKMNEKIQIFDDKTNFLPIEEYLELCRSHLIKHLNWIDKGKAPTTLYTALESLDIKVVTLKKLVKAIDSKTLSQFIDKKKGFNVGAALNRLCEDVINARAKEK